MRQLLLIPLIVCLFAVASCAQSATDWVRLKNYAQAISAADADSLCLQPTETCLIRQFTQIIYGYMPRRMSYQGVPPRLDTAWISRLARQFLADAKWDTLLDSLKAHDLQYRQMTTYCMRCLVDDYVGDSLTTE